MPKSPKPSRSLARTSEPAAAPRPTLTTPPRPSHIAGISGLRPVNGTVRACIAQRGELLRHRVMSADGKDVAVTTTLTPNGYATAVYPVQNGYLVMVCQPLYETSSASAEAAREQHEQLVRVLAELGVRLVRARRYRAQRDEASEHAEASEQLQGETPTGEPIAALGATA